VTTTTTKQQQQQQQNYKTTTATTTTTTTLTRSTIQTMMVRSVDTSWLILTILGVLLSVATYQCRKPNLSLHSTPWVAPPQPQPDTSLDRLPNVPAGTGKEEEQQQQLQAQQQDELYRRDLLTVFNGTAIPTTTVNSTTSSGLGDYIPPWTDATLPEALDSQLIASMLPSNAIGPFRIRMIWSPESCWQGDCRYELDWCMQCEGFECSEGDILWIEICRNIDQQLFVWIPLKEEEAEEEEESPPLDDVHVGKRNLQLHVLHHVQNHVLANSHQVTTQAATTPSSSNVTLVTTSVNATITTTFYDANTSARFDNFDDDPDSSGVFIVDIPVEEEEEEDYHVPIIPDKDSFIELPTTSSPTSILSPLSTNSTNTSSTNTSSFLPTTAATTQPSRVPTLAPTLTPSQHPTDQWSAFPTNTPSLSPSDTPTATLSSPPSDSASQIPTQTWSLAPSEKQSWSPTLIGTESLSLEPSGGPSISQTMAPTSGRPITQSPTTSKPTTQPPITRYPNTEPPTTGPPSTHPAITTFAPSTSSFPTHPPTIETADPGPASHLGIFKVADLSKNLCLDRMDGKRFLLKKCDQSTSQQFFGIPKKKHIQHSFEFHPRFEKSVDASTDNCVNSHHHPRNYEEVMIISCNQARFHRTSRWTIVLDQDNSFAFNQNKNINTYLMGLDDSPKALTGNPNLYTLLEPRPDPKCSPQTQCGVCQGHCSTDDDCVGRLKCFERTWGNDLETPPGCVGEGIPSKCWRARFLSWSVNVASHVCGFSLLQGLTTAMPSQATRLRVEITHFSAFSN
jgi:hypothetical protein